MADQSDIITSFTEREYKTVALGESDLQWFGEQLLLGERLAADGTNLAKAYGWRSGVEARLASIDPWGESSSDSGCLGVWRSAQWFHGNYPKNEIQEWTIIHRSVEILRSFVDKKSVATRLKWRGRSTRYSEINSASSRKVFIVHGHNESVREAVARFLEKIGFDPIILHEKANRGKTIIEKIEAHSDVDFAVILLTPDDEGRVSGGVLAPRARQNVLLEMGYFFARLKRENICVLKSGDLEMPSDFAGVVWETMDKTGGWRRVLGRELEAAGHEVDWNKVMRA